MVHPAPRLDCETRESPPKQPKSLAQGQFGPQVKAQSKSRRGKVVELLVPFSKQCQAGKEDLLFVWLGWGKVGVKGIGTNDLFP